jgi:hypothetical protein
MLALPALLNAQAPSRSKAGPASTGMSHGIATQIQGDVAGPDEVSGPDTQEGLNEGDDQNNDGDVEQGGVNEHEDLNNEVGDQAGQSDAGQDEGSTPAPARSGLVSHKP